MSAVGRMEFEKKLYARVYLSQKEIQLIMLAYKLAKYGHRNQKRDDGERYFEHPKRAALILMDECGVSNPAMLITALLHDIKEDSFILTWDDIELIFGNEIRKMIEILTKNNNLEKTLKDKVYSHGLLTSPSEVRIIKLADRLDNMRCLEGCSSEKQKEYLEETMDFYLPLAEITNGHLHWLLENECKKYQKSC